MITEDNNNNTPVYFKSLTIEGVNCFKSKQTIDLTNGKGEPAMWTVILGNNNTGKTTVLRCLALLSYRQIYEQGYEKGFFVPLGNRNQFDTYFNNSNKQQKYSVSCNFSFFLEPNWSFGYKKFEDYDCFMKHCNATDKLEIKKLKIDAYGTQRKEGKSSYIEYKLTDHTESLFKDDGTSFVNAEEWFLGTTFNALQGDSKSQQNLDNIKNTLISILPDIKDIEIGGNGNRRVHFITNSGNKVLVNQLGSGYQSLVTWVVDFAKRMFDRYPESADPLAEPAIVLVDEIDLHLHPEWQRKIVAFLREKFPKTQFIVTAHSPLVVQSADDINVVVLQKDEEKDDVQIYQPTITNFQGWTVEEILSDLMKMGDKIYSNQYLSWIQQFDNALDKDDYNSAKEAYDNLEKIVHSTATLKMLRLQMSSLMPQNHD